MEKGSTVSLESEQQLDLICTRKSALNLLFQIAHKTTPILQNQNIDLAPGFDKGHLCYEMTLIKEQHREQILLLLTLFPLPDLFNKSNTPHLIRLSLYFTVKKMNLEDYI